MTASPSSDPAGHEPPVQGCLEARERDRRMERDPQCFLAVPLELGVAFSTGSFMRRAAERPGS